MEKEQHGIPEGNCAVFVLHGETECEGPKTTTSDLTSSCFLLYNHNKSLQGELVWAYLACMPLFAELAHKTWIGPEVYE